MKTNFALPPGSLVLVTGANGYIGSHIIDQVLAQGYHVRGTVRSEKPWLDALFESRHGPGVFESVVVPRLDEEDALLKMMEGVTGLVHVASEVSFNTNAGEVIPQVVAATVAVLSAAQKQSVKRVVLTSSSSAALLPQPGVRGITVTQDSWDDPAVKAAWDSNTPADKKAYAVYAASKTEGERAAWRWVEENRPSFVFNAVLPNLNTGTVLHKEIAGSTMKMVADLLDGNDGVIHFIPPQWFIDVQDDAKLHVIALLDPEVKSERLFGFCKPFSWTEVTGILRRLRPEAPVPVVPEGELLDLSDILPAKRAEQLLKSFYGHGWSGFEESLQRGVDSMGK